MALSQKSKHLTEEEAKALLDWLKKLDIRDIALLNKIYEFLQRQKLQ